MTDIGTLAISMGMDIADVKKGISTSKKQFNDLSKSIEKNTKLIDKSTKSSGAGIRELSAEFRNLSKYTRQSVSSVNSSLRSMQKQVDKTQQQFKLYDAQLKKIVQDHKREIKELEKSFNSSIREVSKDFRDLSKYVRQSVSQSNKEIRSLQSQVKKLKASSNSSLPIVSKQLDGISKSARNTSSAFNGFIKTVRAAALGYATVLATMKIADFTTGIISQGAALDSLQRSYKAITGSMVDSNRILGMLRKSSNEYGLSLTSMEKSYQNILAASRNTSLEGREIERVFQSVIKASAVLGMSADDTSGTLRALSQMISKGNVQAEELRGQLGERLPGAFQMAAEAMGVTTQQLNKMLEQGQVAASDLLPKLADVLERRFGDAAEDAGDRAGAAFERFSNAIVNAQRRIAESGILDFFADLADASANVLNLLSGVDDLDPINARMEELRNRIYEIENAEKIANDARVKRLDEEREKLEKGRAAAAAYEQTLMSGFNLTSSARGIKKEDILETLKFELIDAQARKAALGVDSLNASFVRLVDTSAEIPALRKALNDLNNAEITAFDPKKLTTAYKEVTDEIKRLTLSSYDYQKQKYEEDVQEYIKLGGSKETAEKLLQLKLKKLREEETLKQKAEYDKQVKAAQDAAKEKLKAQQALDLQLISNIDAINLTEKERRMQVDKDLFGQTKKILKDKADAEEKATKDRVKAEEKAAQEIQKEWERVYDNMHEFASDTFYDIFDGQIDSFEDFTDGMLDIFKRMLANMAASAAMANIFKPLLQNVVGSSVANVFGLSNSGSSGGFGLMDGLGLGKSLLPKSWTSGISNFLGLGATGPVTGPVAGVEGIFSVPGMGAGNMAGTGLMSGLGSFLPVLGAGLGIYSLLNAFKSKDVPQVAINSGTYSGDATYMNKMRNYGQINAPGDFDFSVWADDIGDVGSSGRLSFADGIAEYFTNKFGKLDEQFEWSLQDVINSSDFSSGTMVLAGYDTSTAEGMQKLMSDMGGNIFSGIRANLINAAFGALPDYSEMVTEAVKVGTEIVSIEGERGQKITTRDLYENQTYEKTSSFADQFTTEFFEGLSSAGDAFDGFGVFVSTLDDMDNGMDRLIGQMGDFDLSASEAFGNLSTITTTLTATDAALDALTQTQTLTALDAISEAWNKQILLLEDAHASTEELNKVRADENKVIGATITGLTASNLQAGLLSGDATGHMVKIFNANIAAVAAAGFAEDISAGYFTELNEAMGAAAKEHGWLWVAEHSQEIVDESFDVEGFESEMEAAGKAMDKFTDGIQDLTAQLDSFSGGFTSFLAPIFDALYDDMTIETSGINTAAQQLKESLGSLGLDDSDYAMMTSAVDQIRQMRIDLLHNDAMLNVGEWQAGLGGMENQWTIAKVQSRYSGFAPDLDLNTMTGLEDLITRAATGSYGDILNFTQTSGIGMDTLMDDMNDLASVVQDMTSEFDELIDGIIDFKDELLGIKTATLPLNMQYDSAKALMTSTYAKALTGDKDALASFPDIARDFLDLSRETQGDMFKNQEDIDTVYSLTAQLPKYFDPDKYGEITKADFADSLDLINTIDQSINRNAKLTTGVFRLAMATFGHDQKISFDLLNKNLNDMLGLSLLEGKVLFDTQMDGFASVLTTLQGQFGLSIDESYNALASALLETTGSAMSELSTQFAKNAGDAADGFISDAADAAKIFTDNTADTAKIFTDTSAETAAQFLTDSVDASETFTGTSAETAEKFLKNSVAASKDFQDGSKLLTNKFMETSSSSMATIIANFTKDAKDAAVKFIADSGTAAGSVSSGILSGSADLLASFASDVDFFNGQDVSTMTSNFENIFGASAGILASISGVFNTPEANAFFSKYEELFGANPFENLEIAMFELVATVPSLVQAVGSIPKEISVNVDVTGSGGTSTTVTPVDTTPPGPSGDTNAVSLSRLKTISNLLGVSFSDVYGDQGRTNINAFLGMTDSEMEAMMRSKLETHEIGLVSGLYGYKQLVNEADELLRSTGFADGGISSGPDSGYMAKLHGTEAVIPLNMGHIPIEFKGMDFSGLMTEIAGLKEENTRMRQHLYQISKNVLKMKNTSDKWDSEGIPEERAT